MQKIVICFWLVCLYGAHGNADQVSDYEKRLYLTAAGKYTEEDISANGSMTPSQKFKEFVSAHALPESGDKTCPITGSKAHPQYTWIIGGHSYQFCSPSCIDEFLLLAKEHPEEIKEPGHYTKKP
jgi:YHS domain-containing protein